MATEPAAPVADPDGIREIRVGVHCTGAQARELVERIQQLLCPDPGHAPPCPVPWSIAHWSLDDDEAADTYPELLEQARIEKSPGRAARAGVDS